MDYPYHPSAPRLHRLRVLAAFVLKTIQTLDVTVVKYIASQLTRGAIFAKRMSASFLCWFWAASGQYLSRSSSNEKLSVRRIRSLLASQASRNASSALWVAAKCNANTILQSGSHPYFFSRPFKRFFSHSLILPVL
ncbi:hypothetical protein D3C80_1462810 [compost metagenome]